MVLTAEERRERNRKAVQRYRRRQTPENQDEKRRRDRERQRQRRHDNGRASNQQSDAATATCPYSQVEPSPVPESFDVSRVNSEQPGWGDKHIPRLHPVPAAAKEEALRRLRLALGAYGLDEVTCAVCDCRKLQSSCHVVEVSDAKRIEQMRALLSSDVDGLPAALIADYDCSNRNQALGGMFLSKRGVRHDGKLDICDECNSSLLRHSIPKYAIKNGFFVGELPRCFAEITLPERLMTQLVSVVAVTRVMRGGAHRCIRSHCLAFDCSPGPPATLLPRSIGSAASYRVVLAGPFTTEQQAQARRMHRVRRQVVDDLLKFYKQYNELYATVAVSCSGLSADAVLDNIIFEEPDADAEVDDINADHDRVGGLSENDSTTDETEVAERRVVFISDDIDVSMQNATASASHSRQSVADPQLLVRHSTRFAHKDNTLLARMFPHLFPYGRGHPGEKRHVTVSFEACIRHYCELSLQQFAEDELFVVVCFDQMALQKMYTHVALRCKRNPSRFEAYSDITEEALLKALSDKELRRQGRKWKPTDGGTTAQTFLRTVEMSGAALWGSDAERAQCRRNAFAYQARYGQPALFVTLTPNVADSFVMAKYTGVTSIDTLFDANLAELPRKSALNSACLKNDVASARLFMRNMDAFIEHVLGVAPSQMRSKPFDGLFGEVEAYFGTVETQGGGTLHAHFLVWLAAAPPNSEAFDQAVSVHGDQYFRDVEAFADSIVSTSLPLHLEASTCVFCGHTYADLQELSIPVEAYEDPGRKRGSTRGEPLLVRCSGCGKEMSSQHVLRRLLLESRPPSWPPLMREYSADELKTAVRLETPCRGSAAAAKAAVAQRDLMLSASEPDADLAGDYLRALNDVPWRPERRQDDLLRADVVARAVVMQPPSLDDQRWSSRAAAFAVSMLVFMLNLHWWSHAGSCFKKARGALRGQCRYGFPRPRVGHTSCTSDGVTLARRAPFEFVNGFNAEIMLAFKSNHDIQVMIGGKQALLRIFYATKYVTKMQEQIDSITAVALAAFKRRQLRELRDEASLDVPRSAVGRRRVTSLMFAITNRREVAGPLAALYLLRESCAYMSTLCAPLPLRNVLDELVGEASHACDLVQLHESGCRVRFRTASFLDDYRYRPTVLGQLSLYEFVMKHFRRKRTETTADAALFAEDHPLFGSHCLGTRKADVVPVIAGIRMPYLDSDSPREIVVKRSQCALVLFKPFRTAKDLVQNPSSCDSWIEEYARWEFTRTGFIRGIMANMDDYYVAAKLAKESGESSGMMQNHGADDDAVTGTRDDVDGALDRIVASLETREGTDDFIDMFDNVGLDDDHCGDGTESSIPIFPTLAPGTARPYRDLLAGSAQSTALSGVDARDSNMTLDFSLAELQQFVASTSNDVAKPQQQPNQELDERPTEVVALIASELESVCAWTPPPQPAQTSQPLQPYTSIVQVSKAFTLNQRQHAAFVTIAKALLRRFLRQELDDDHENSQSYSVVDFEVRFRDDQLLMFLGGPGGTGKSRVIDAVNSFCCSWHRGESIIKAALTGKAATLIGGRTLASFLMRLKHAIKDKRFDPIDILVIDEVSMMSKSEFLRLDKHLRRHTQVLGVPFGGVHIVLVGDFLQMPPVNADPIYIRPDEKMKPSTTDIEGFDLWRTFTTVVILEESVRFRADPEWGAGCSLARLGQWTPEFIALVNSRVLLPVSDSLQNPSASQPQLSPQYSWASPSQLRSEVGADAVFVSPENATRLAINNAFVTETASMLPSTLFPVRVVANFKGALNGLSRSDLQYVFSLPDNRFGRMAPYLDLIVGMPVQVTQNVATAKGVANGTLGSLQSVHFPPSTTFRLVRDGASGTIVQLPNQSPEYALIRAPRPRATPIRPGIDPELFPVFYATEAYAKVNISLPKAPDGTPRTLTVKPQQLPLVCAVGSTIYKVQGETLSSMVVVDWRSKQGVVNKPQQTYLLVSRVTSRKAFIALQPFTTELAAWSKPPANALREETRLNSLSNITLASFLPPQLGVCTSI